MLLTDVVSPYKRINITEGIFKDQIPQNITSTSVLANQPEGNICLSSPYLKQTATGKCDAVEKNIAPYLLTGNYSCQIEANVC